jgi:uncharacterized protein YeaO (DUF488 family)
MSTNLRVFTARISYGGADRLDVTRKSAGPDGLPFAPSWGIVRPMIDARARWKRDDVPADARLQEEAVLWDAYLPAYIDEMRTSYRRARSAWEAVLTRVDVTFCCYCVGAAHCHRTPLAAIYEKLGAVIIGERPAPVSARRAQRERP